MIQFHFVFTLSFVISCTCCLAEQSSETILRVIGNPLTSTNEFVDALKALSDSRQTNEPASFWTTIANNPKYSCENRTKAVLQLAHRHFRPGMTFKEIGQLFDHPNWIDPLSLGGPSFSGGLPPHFSEQDGLAFVSIVACKRSPHPQLYFRSSQDHFKGADELYRCLKGEATNSQTANVKVDEIVSCERIHGEWVYNAWGISPETIQAPKPRKKPALSK